MATDYIVRLKCPYGDQEKLVLLENREETLQQILETRWDFECPAHGVQREIPLVGSQKSSWSRSRLPLREASDQAAPRPRSSKRISLHIPVLILGRSQGEGSFCEKTTTLFVNASGGLVPLNTPVAVGDTVFIGDQERRQEQECRVAYVGTDVYGNSLVGIAFKRPAPHFWRANRREARISKRIRVTVRGSDRNGNPFVQTAYALDVSRHGARLDGIGYLTCPGETVQLKHHWRIAHFRVAWVGQVGTPQDGQVGIFALEPKKNFWGVALPCAAQSQKIESGVRNDNVHRPTGI